MEIEERLSKSKLVVFPVGSVEQHGHHIGVGADWIQAWEIAKRVGEKSSALVLPVLCYGVSGHHKEFPGVLTMSSQTYSKVVFEILESLNRYGVERVLFINGHGGNTGGLIEAAKKARDDFGIICAVSHWWDILCNNPIFGHPAEEHAGYAETALTLASEPGAVRLERAVLTETRQVDEEIQLIRAGLARFKDGIIRIPLRTVDVTDTGSMTEAHPADTPETKDFSMITPKYAEGLMNEVVEWLVEFIQRFKSFKVPDVQIRRQ